MAGNIDFDHPEIRYAPDQIKDQYGVTASVQQKLKQLRKFGRSTQVSNTTRTTLMTLPAGTFNETFLTDNDITHVASSDDGDNGSLYVEGHTIDGNGNLTFTTQTVTLDGQVKTALTTPLARCSRMYNATGTEWAGSIYAAEDVTFTSGVPQTDSAVHCMIDAGFQQSEKASTSLSSVDYWIVAGFDAYCFEKTATKVEVSLEVRQQNGVFRQQRTITCSDGHTGRVEFRPFFIVPPNSDIRLRGLASAAGADVGGTIHGGLAIVN